MRKVLITAIVILSLLLAAMLGFIWYTSAHYFIDGEAYAKNAQQLDLREKEVTEYHYLKVQAQLPDCKIIWNVPFQGGIQSSDAQQLTIASVSEEDIRLLKTYFPELKQIQAADCRDYEMLARLAQALPDCKVVYQIPLGQTMAEPDAAELTLQPGEFDFDTLMANLVYFPKLTTLHLPKAELSLEQQETLKEFYPQISLTSTVVILGKEYDSATTSLDLSAMTAADVEAVAAKLGMLPQLAQAELMKNGYSSLTLEDVQKLKAAAPAVDFRYSFVFCGVGISTSDEEVVLKELKNADQETAFPQKLRAILDVMTDCERIVVEGKSMYDKIWKVISNEELAKIREEYQDRTKVVWRVYFGANGTALTDAQALRAVSGLTEKNGDSLRYCNEVMYMDLGHNELLNAVDFVSGMTSLEAVIVSGAPIVSLDPFAACKNLKFLEIANCLYIPNIDAVKECTQLEMLNISFTKIEDLSPLEDLKLTHLCTVKNPLVSQNEPEEALQTFIDANPNCLVTYKGDQPYGKGWRTDEEGKLFGWYAKLEDVFHYARYFEGGSINNQLGWRLDTK